MISHVYDVIDIVSIFPVQVPACNSDLVYTLYWGNSLHERHLSMAFAQQVQNSAPLEFYRCGRYEDAPSYSNAATLPAAP